MPRNSTDNGSSSKLMNIIRRVAESVFRRLIKGYPREWVAVVQSASIAPNATGTVFLNGDLTSTPITVRNKSWETIVSGQEIFLHSPTGSLSNCVILYSK